MTPNLYAADTNVLVYLHDNSNNTKRAIAQNILADNPKIPAQVISEYLNTTKRILNIPKSELLIFDAIIVSACLESGCNVLYSEDMHLKLIVNDVLTIINPFIT
jgi:predicted nucleic acid-binding protein